MDFDFIGSAYTANSITQDAQDLVNWYCEVDVTKSGKDRGVIALYPTPGRTLLATLDPTGPIRGMMVIPGGSICLMVCGNKLFSVTTGYVSTLAGALLTSTGPVSITNNGTSAYLCDGPNRYTYVWGTATFAVVSDGAFNGANTVDVVDNFIVYDNPNSNQFGCTNVGSVSSGALNFASTLAAPGNVTGLICDHRQVFLLCENTGEVWTDVGSFPFPFAIVPGASMQHGCAARGSIARLGESFAFLARDTRGQAVVVMMNGYAPIRISTHAIEQAIQKYSVISDAIAYSYQQNGHEFYVLTFPSADATWVYDLSTSAAIGFPMWHRRGWRDSKNVLHRDRSNSQAVFGGNVIVGDFENGNIYKMDLTNFTDNGDTIPCIRTCRHLTNGLKRVFYKSLQLQFQPGVGSSSATDPQANLEWSNDGGFTWSNGRLTAIGQSGAYRHRAIWRQLGESRDRIFRVTVTDPVFRAVISAELDGRAGAH